MHCQLRLVSSTVPASANHGCTGLAYCRKPHTRFHSGHGTLQVQTTIRKRKNNNPFYVGSVLFVAIWRRISKKKQEDSGSGGGARGRVPTRLYVHVHVQVQVQYASMYTTGEGSNWVGANMYNTYCS